MNSKMRDNEPNNILDNISGINDFVSDNLTSSHLIYSEVPSHYSLFDNTDRDESPLFDGPLSKIEKENNIEQEECLMSEGCCDIEGNTRHDEKDDGEIPDDEEFLSLYTNKISNSIKSGEKIIYMKINNESQFIYSGCELYVTPKGNSLMNLFYCYRLINIVGVFEQPEYVTISKYHERKTMIEDAFELGKRIPDQQRNIIRLLSDNWTVDKYHAKLSWKSAYNTHSPWIRSFFCFLWVQKYISSQKNINKYAILRRIPLEINELIFQFVQGK